MKKNEISRQTINQIYDKVYCAGYCDLAHIFYNKSRRAYNSGVYGWNFDLFTDCTKDGDIIAFTTGYRNMTGDRIPSELLQKYDQAARDIISSRGPWEEIEKKLDDNRRAFIEELIA